jgi:hypothetical protein
MATEIIFGKGEFVIVAPSPDQVAEALNGGDRFVEFRSASRESERESESTVWIRVDAVHSFTEPVRGRWTAA